MYLFGPNNNVENWKTTRFEWITRNVNKLTPDWGEKLKPARFHEHATSELHSEVHGCLFLFGPSAEYGWVMMNTRCQKNIKNYFCFCFHQSFNIFCFSFTKTRVEAMPKTNYSKPIINNLSSFMEMSLIFDIWKSASMWLVNLWFSCVPGRVCGLLSSIAIIWDSFVTNLYQLRRALNWQ